MRGESLMREPSLTAKLGAELLGTFLLVFAGCGSVVIAGQFLNKDGVELGIGLLGIGLAFGLAVLVGAFAFGHVSGGHFNPAVSIGLAIAKRFEWKGVLPYVVTQVVAASVAGAVLLVIASAKSGFSAVESGFASNGYGDRSPGGYGLLAALLIEIIMTAIFVYIILGATDDRAPKGFAPIAIGLGLTIIHLASIPVDGTSVNPARSLGVAWFAGGAALAQVWLFIIGPIVGAVIAGATYAIITGAGTADVGVAQNPELEEHRQPA
jgi:aquaporin Z